MQSTIIENLNAYFQWHNLPIAMNKSGICNGLASVYVKYALQGLEEKFLQILQCIADETSPALLPKEEVNQFVREVLLSFHPEIFDKKLSQRNSIEALSINHLQLKDSFNLALTASNNHWEAVLQTIDLQEDEVMLLKSINHTVSVSKKGNQYIIYDPNYESGVKTFSNEKELLLELHQPVFRYDEESLGMELFVIRHPEHPPRAFPNTIDLYDRYQTPELLADGPKTCQKQFKTLESTATIGTAEEINKLIEIGGNLLCEEDYFGAVEQAIVHNNPDTLRTLLTPIQVYPPYKEMYFITVALAAGRTAVFDELLRHEAFMTAYDTLSTNQDFAPISICAAAKGGNPELLADVLADSKEKVAVAWHEKKESVADEWDESKEAVNTDQLTNVWLASKILESNNKREPILEAIESGSLGCVRMLLEHIHQAQDALTPLEQKNWDTKKLRYLRAAIRLNQPNIVEYLIKHVPQAFVQTLSFSRQAVQETNLSILKKLQENSVSFSPHARKIIAEKAHCKVSMMLRMGILLIDFLDFINIFKTCLPSARRETQSMRTDEKFTLFHEKYEEIEAQADKAFTETISFTHE